MKMFNYDRLLGCVVGLFLVLVVVVMCLNASTIRVRNLEAEVEHLEIVNKQASHREGDLGKEAWQIIDSLVSFNNLLIEGLEECQNGE